MWSRKDRHGSHLRSGLVNACLSGPHHELLAEKKPGACRAAPGIAWLILPMIIRLTDNCCSRGTKAADPSRRMATRSGRSIDPWQGVSGISRISTTEILTTMRSTVNQIYVRLTMEKATLHDESVWHKEVAL